MWSLKGVFFYYAIMEYVNHTDCLELPFQTLQHTNLKIRWGILLFLNESSAIALDVRRSCIAQNAIVFRDIDLQCPVYQRAEYQFACLELVRIISK